MPVSIIVAPPALIWSSWYSSDNFYITANNTKNSVSISIEPNPNIESQSVFSVEFRYVDESGKYISQFETFGPEGGTTLIEVGGGEAQMSKIHLRATANNPIVGQQLVISGEQYFLLENVSPEVGENTSFIDQILERVDKALSWGDPHLVTFDGVGYDFQMPGEFVLTQSTDSAMPFAVQVRHEKYFVLLNKYYNDNVSAIKLLIV